MNYRFAVLSLLVAVPASVVCSNTGRSGCACLTDLFSESVATTVMRAVLTGEPALALRSPHVASGEEITAKSSPAPSILAGVRSASAGKSVWYQDELPGKSDTTNYRPAGGRAWIIGPFTRAANQPVIRPDPASEFSDPITGRVVHWEALHTFNPAAIVKDGKIFVLYRAEDDSGEMKIGGHVSRLGLAGSTDGIHFTRLAEPVFYPSADSESVRESPGGVEDPRLVEGPDGAYILTYTQWSSPFVFSGLGSRHHET